MKKKASYAIKNESKKLLEINATLIVKDTYQNAQGKKVTEGFRTLIPVTVEMEPKEEHQQLAMEWSLKLLKDMGFDVVITQGNYEALSKRFNLIVTENENEKN